jgi:ABC-type lipoprotein export system ATPase subunit
MEKSQQDIVRLVQVSKSFYLAGGLEVPVLHDINLTIKEGEMVALLGQSGSGKSTLMNLIGGLDVPTLGEYFFEGRKVNDMTQDELAELRSSRISFVFQSFHLLSGKTAYQNVALPLYYQRTFTGNHDEYVRHALNRAALEEEQWHKRPNQMSGGQRLLCIVWIGMMCQNRYACLDACTHHHLRMRAPVTVR